MTTPTRPSPELEDRPRSELAWFRQQVRLAIVAPRAFSGALAREHFGLAGIAVTLAAGASLSLAVDLLVVAARGIDPLAFAPRLIIDAFFVAVRMAVTAAALAFVAIGALRLLRREEAPTLDQLTTAIAFALAPMLLALPVALPAAIAPVLGPVAALLLIALAARVAYGVALNVRALVPLPVAALTVAGLVVAGAWAFADEITRVRFITYAYLPELAPALAAEPASGAPYERFGISLTLPERWHHATRGIAGEIARFETDRDVLVVTSAGGGAFLTPGDLADQIARDELLGMTSLASRRDVVRIGDAIVVDDRHTGTSGGRRLALRQFTTVRGPRAYALVFRSIEPADAESALAEDASIAATWRIAGP